MTGTRRWKPIRHIPHILITEDIGPQILIPCGIKVFCQNIFYQIDNIHRLRFHAFQPISIYITVLYSGRYHSSNFLNCRQFKLPLMLRQFQFLFAARSFQIRKYWLMRKGKNAKPTCQIDITHYILFIDDFGMFQDAHIAFRLIRHMFPVNDSTAFIVYSIFRNCRPFIRKRRHFFRQFYFI